MEMFQIQKSELAYSSPTVTGKSEAKAEENSKSTSISSQSSAAPPIKSSKWLTREKRQPPSHASVAGRGVGKMKLEKRGCKREVRGKEKRMKAREENITPTHTQVTLQQRKKSYIIWINFSKDLQSLIKYQINNERKINE